MHHLVDEGPLACELVLMVGNAYHHYLGMQSETGKVLLGRSAKLQDEEFQRSLYGRDERHCLGREDGEGVRRAVIDVVVNDIPPSVCLRFLVSHVHIVGLLSLFRRNDYWQAVATDILHSHCLPARRMKPVVGIGLHCRNHHVSLPSGDIVCQMLGHRNLCLGLLAQRHTYGVADAVGEQCSNAYSALYAAVLTLASLRYTEMERVVHVLMVHGVYEQPYRLDHHYGIR